MLEIFISYLTEVMYLQYHSSFLYNTASAYCDQSLRKHIFYLLCPHVGILITVAFSIHLNLSLTYKQHFQVTEN